MSDVVILPQIRCETISMVCVYYIFFVSPLPSITSCVVTRDTVLTFCWQCVEKKWCHQMSEWTCRRIYRKWYKKMVCVHDLFTIVSQKLFSTESNYFFFIIVEIGVNRKPVSRYQVLFNTFNIFNLALLICVFCL